MSTSTTSARPASAMRCAVVAPTFPAPITVTLLRAISRLLVAWGRPCCRPSALAGRRDLGLRGAIDPGRAGRANGLAHAIGVGLEVLVEHRCDRRGCGVVGRGVCPCLARRQ